VPTTDYGLNRAIDATVRGFTWGDLDSLLQNAQVPRRSRLLQVARTTVKQAQAMWPTLLEEAPANLRNAVTERLQGGVELAR
jgi:serine/threonine-protein kinase HipA